MELSRDHKPTEKDEAKRIIISNEDILNKIKNTYKKSHNNK